MDLFIASIFIPVLMLLLLIFLKFKPPTEINGLYGVRIKRAMKSKGAWNYANKLFFNV